MVSELRVNCRDAAASQIDTTMTFTVLIVSIEQNEEFQELRVHYTLAGIKSPLKIGEGGVPEPMEPSPGYARGKTIIMKR